MCLFQTAYTIFGTFNLLGLIGYYRKFVPRFSDLSRPLTRLTRHDAKFEWSEKCKKSFNRLLELLMELPNFKIPRSLEAIHYLHGCKWNWVEWSTYTEDQDDKGRVKSHPICFISCQFTGSQLNWAALTKEAYAIYMSVRRTYVLPHGCRNHYQM